MSKVIHLQSSSTAPLLEVEDVSVAYDTRHGPLRAVDRVSFSAWPGDRIGIIGESGSGKTTLAGALLRLTRPPARIEGGRVLIGGRDILSLSEAELRAARLAEIAYIPQGSMASLNPVVRVGEQVADGILAHRPEAGRAEVEERVKFCLERVGLRAEVANKFPHELSGGMRQRLVIAIATSLNPRLIIADEPTSALDVVVQRQVIHTLFAVQKELNAVVLLIGHDMGLMAQFATRIGVMYAGQLIELGAAAQVVAAPEHPYTRALIGALPTLERRRSLVGLSGLPPSLSQMPPGCRFHPRCPSAVDACSSVEPATTGTGQRLVKCHLHVPNLNDQQLARPAREATSP